MKNEKDMKDYLRKKKFIITAQITPEIKKFKITASRKQQRIMKRVDKIKDVIL